MLHTTHRPIPLERANAAASQSSQCRPRRPHFDKRRLLQLERSARVLLDGALSSVCGVSRKDRCRNCDVRERRGVKEEVVTGAERGVLRRFGHLGGCIKVD
ncbi:hypothetical protein EVAR_92965_1 [Eumeta japonica]|uniref:Uncharacterized protein n=1 Tax=Eumeta variegata TaxID=151549 RepID=A0A4C1TAE8_EUMVA|nr:hypothetical protein EVAR_92965_1 [Eumeta japonica]